MTGAVMLAAVVDPVGKLKPGNDDSWIPDWKLPQAATHEGRAVFWTPTDGLRHGLELFASSVLALLLGAGDDAVRRSENFI